MLPRAGISGGSMICIWVGENIIRCCELVTYGWERVNGFVAVDRCILCICVQSLAAKKNRKCVLTRCDYCIRNLAENKCSVFTRTENKSIDIILY